MLNFIKKFLGFKQEVCGEVKKVCKCAESTVIASIIIADDVAIVEMAESVIELPVKKKRKAPRSRKYAAKEKQTPRVVTDAPKKRGRPKKV